MRALLVATIALALSGCADNRKMCGKEYETYGFINRDEIRDPSVKYSLSVGNIIWSVVLVETVIAPIYFLGFSLYEPVDLKTGCAS